MKNIRFFLMITLVILLSSGYVIQNASAAERHLAIADTYTDLNETADNYGSEPYIQLSASNLAGCYPTSYLWFKFDVPELSETIGYAELVVPFSPYGDDGMMPLELRSSADVDWGETTITWATQPALDSTVLATRASTPRGSDALFESDALAAYLNYHKGKTITLVLKADCSGAVSPSSTRTVVTKENPAGTNVELILRNDATAVGLQSFTSHNKNNSIAPITAALAGILFVLGLIYQEKNHKSKE
jgi:hypothetical protein